MVGSVCPNWAWLLVFSLYCRQTHVRSSNASFSNRLSFPQQFLAFNPSRRISAFAALSHPYFQSVDSHSRSVYAAQPIPGDKPTMEERTA